jgi:cell division protein FtsI (penicillin-binding protein 3)
MLATPLQVLRGYCAFANGGCLVTPHVLCEIVDEGYVVSRPYAAPPKRVLSEETAKTMREMLKEVVANGTATAAKVEGMEVAGKTGTTQVVDPVTHQYLHDMHISSFVGFAPADNAEIAMIVVLDRPKGESYGGKVAAPVVGRVLSRAKHLIGKEAEWARIRREMLLQGEGY